MLLQILSIVAAMVAADGARCYCPHTGGKGIHFNADNCNSPTRLTWHGQVNWIPWGWSWEGNCYKCILWAASKFRSNRCFTCVKNWSGMYIRTGTSVGDV